MRIGDIKMRIDPECEREKPAAIGRIAVEEIAVVEIAICARKSDGVRGLVEREIIAVGKGHCVNSSIKISSDP